MTRLYKILTPAEWSAADDFVPWSPDDRRDGFMHLSTEAQTLETAARHFRGCGTLVALEIDESDIAGDLRYEASRGGALFPHLYGALPRRAVRRVRALIESPDGFAFGDDL